MKRSQPPAERRRPPRLFVSALPLLALLSHASAFAQSAEPDPTRLVFRSPPGCGSSEDFAARVQKRSARIRLVAGGSALRTLVVDIQAAPQAGAALPGSVTVIEPDGTTRARRLKAKSCEDAVEGLALIATVSLDPEALFEEAPAEPKPVAPAKPPPAKPKRPPPPPPRVRPPVPPGPSYRVSVAADAVTLFGVAPEALLGGQGALALELRPGRLVAPMARASVAHAQRRGLPANRGSASFALTLATLELCPIRLGNDAFGLRPCVAGAAGGMVAWGAEASFQSETHRRPFAAAGPALLAELRISQAVEIVANIRGTVAILRDQYAFDLDPFFTTSALGFSSGVGLAVGFP